MEYTCGVKSLVSKVHSGHKSATNTTRNTRDPRVLFTTREISPATLEDKIDQMVPQNNIQQQLNRSLIIFLSKAMDDLENFRGFSRFHCRVVEK